MTVPGSLVPSCTVVWWSDAEAIPSAVLKAVKSSPTPTRDWSGIEDYATLGALLLSPSMRSAELVTARTYPRESART